MEYRTYFVSRDGADSLGCGRFEHPCRNLQHALEDSASKKMIFLNDSYPDHTYILDLRHVGDRIVFLEIIGLSYYLQPRAQLDHQTTSIIDIIHGNHVLLGNPGKTYHYAFRNIKLHGNLKINGNGADFSLKLINVVMGKSRGLSDVGVHGCSSLNLQLENTVLTNIKLHATSDTVTEVLFRKVTMVSEDGVTLSHNGGALFDLSGKDGNHLIHVESSSFQNLGHNQENIWSSGALVIKGSDKTSKLKVFISNSSFTCNARGVNIAMKGETIVEIRNSTFVNNKAWGSGGALHLAAYTQARFHDKTDVRKARITIVGCLFDSNVARRSSFDETNPDEETLGNGGALYVQVSASSPFRKDGMLEIHDSVFYDNRAAGHGASLFIGSEISSSLSYSVIQNTISKSGATNELLYATGTMEVSEVIISAATGSGKSRILTYKATNLQKNKLVVKNLNLICTEGYTADHQLTASSHIQSLQLYCSPCPKDQYRIGESLLTLSGLDVDIDPRDLSCRPCPHGAICDEGIWNSRDFWGSNTSANDVNMYICPMGYCDLDQTIPIAFSSCAPHRVGPLCGACEQGYSESLFGLLCLPNEHCGLHMNWSVAIFLAVFGLFYVLFFMLGRDWSHTMEIITSKLHCRSSRRPEDESSQGIIESGFFGIFMYFIQTATLLTISKSVTTDMSNPAIQRPLELLPAFLTDGIVKLFNFEFPLIEEASCLFPDVTPAKKIGIKIGFFVFLYGLLSLFYVLSGLCCMCRSPKKRLRCGGMRMDMRLFGSGLALLLYTYQCFSVLNLMLLNCQQVEGEGILFYDGNVQCFQSWQYIIICVVSVFVIPLFIVLLFGPKLLKEKRISLKLFIISFAVPLFLAPVLILLYCNCDRKVTARKLKNNPLAAYYKKNLTLAQNNSKNNNNSSKSKYSINIPLDITSCEDESQLIPRTATQDGSLDAMIRDDQNCCGEAGALRMYLIDVLSGPYRTNILGGLCYEGVINLRRLVLVLLFVFISSSFLRQMFLCGACLLFLVLHFKLNPFRMRMANHIEAVSLTLLTIISGTNLVRVSFSHSGTVPNGHLYVLDVLAEWLEVCCFTFLPIGLFTLLLLVLCYKACKPLLSENEDSNSSSKLEGSPGSSNTQNVSSISFGLPNKASPYSYSSHIPWKLPYDYQGSSNRIDLSKLKHKVPTKPVWTPRGTNVSPKRGNRKNLLQSPEFEEQLGMKWFPNYMGDRSVVSSHVHPDLYLNSSIQGPAIYSPRANGVNVDRPSRMTLQCSPRDIAPYIPPLDPPRRESSSTPIRNLQYN